jgi:hypothetical protein
VSLSFRANATKMKQCHLQNRHLNFTVRESFSIEKKFLKYLRYVIIVFPLSVSPNLLQSGVYLCLLDHSEWSERLFFSLSY